MIYGYFMGSMMWYKTDLNSMCYIRIRPVLANSLEWNLGGVIKKNRNPKNPIRTPTDIRTPRRSTIQLLNQKLNCEPTFVFHIMGPLCLNPLTFQISRVQSLVWRIAFLPVTTQTLSTVPPTDFKYLVLDTVWLANP